MPSGFLVGLRPARRTAVLAALIVGMLDLVTKLATVWWLADAPIDLGFVRLVSHRNPGIAFSLGNNAPFAVVVAITVVAVVAIGVAAWREALRPPLAAGLMLGGGLANLVDRLISGSVVDMVDLGWWPVFNVADIALNVGVALVVLTSILGERRGPVTDGAWDNAVAALDRAAGADAVMVDDDA